MISPCHWLLLRIWSRYRGIVQISFVLVVIAGYCFVLGNYAVTNFEQVSNKSRPEPHVRNQPAWSMYQASTLEMVPLLLEQTASSVHFDALGHSFSPEDEIEERRNQVAKVCEKYDLASSGQPNAWEFFINDKHHIVWCNVFKAASSTWMYYFNILAGYKERYLRRTNKTPLILARARFPRPTVTELRAALPNSLSFLVVREPFERLLSAFRNKLENTRHRFYRKMATEMIVKYRKTEDKKIKSPTFPEFVSYVVESANNKKPHYDEHWAPYHAFCTPCHVNFTVISKLETFQRDQDYIIEAAHVEDILVSEVRRSNPKSAVNRARDGRSTNSLVEKYYSQLSLSQVTRLYQIYKIDFEMFGYNATKYFIMAKKSEV